MTRGGTLYELTFGVEVPADIEALAKVPLRSAAGISVDLVPPPGGGSRPAGGGHRERFELLARHLLCCRSLQDLLELLFERTATPPRPLSQRGKYQLRNIRKVNRWQVGAVALGRTVHP